MSTKPRERLVKFADEQPVVTEPAPVLRQVKVPASANRAAAVMAATPIVISAVEVLHVSTAHVPPPPPPEEDEDFPPPPLLEMLSLSPPPPPPPPVQPPPTTRTATKTMTTCSVFTQAILDKLTQSPWSHRKSFPTPETLSTSLEVCYCPTQQVCHAFYQTQHELKSHNDILVCSPQRCGQEALLRALFHLTHEDGNEPLENYVGWVGSSFGEIPRKVTSSQKRLFKTHMNLRPFIKSNAAKSPKVVVVLRDPAYVMDSWMRHTLEVHRLFHPELDLDFSLEDFKECIPGAFNPSLGASKNMVGENYWRFLSLALDSEAKHPQLVKVVFYEQIVGDPHSLVQDLAAFINLPVRNEERICAMWKQRVNTQLLDVSPSLRLYLTETWKKNLTAAFIQNMPVSPSTYYDLYLEHTGQLTYPMPMYVFEKQRASSRFSFSPQRVNSSTKRMSSSSSSASAKKYDSRKFDLERDSSSAAAATPDKKEVKPRKSVFARIFQ